MDLSIATRISTRFSSAVATGNVDEPPRTREIRMRGREAGSAACCWCTHV